MSVLLEKNAQPSTLPLDRVPAWLAGVFHSRKKQKNIAAILESVASCVL